VRSVSSKPSRAVSKPIAGRTSDLLWSLEAAAEDLPASELPALLGELERVRLSLTARLLAPASPPVPIAPTSTPAPAGDRALTAEEVGRRLGKSRWWVYKHRDELPHSPLPGGGFVFSELSLERWISRRTSARA
jgi:predicted DNA-binding transcriptional regulator AlpA